MNDAGATRPEPLVLDRGRSGLGPDPGEAAALVEAVRYFHARGWCPATSSNFSIRSKGQLQDHPAHPSDQSSSSGPPSSGADLGCFISESGVDKGVFGPEHLMAVDLEGRPVPPESRRPSAETLLHTLVYRARPEIRAVLHVHAPLSVVLSRAYLDEGAIRLEGWELQKGLLGVTTHDVEVRVPIFPNAQDMVVLARSIEPILLSQPDLQAFLLAGHGLYAFGRSVAEAKRHVEVVEALLEQLYLWRTLR